MLLFLCPLTWQQKYVTIYIVQGDNPEPVSNLTADTTAITNVRGGI